MDFSRVFFRFDRTPSAAGDVARGAAPVPAAAAAAMASAALGLVPQRLQQQLARMFSNVQPEGFVQEIKSLGSSLGTSAHAVLVSKGCLAGVALYLLRFESVARALKHFCIVGAAGIGLWLNFHLDMDREMCARGVTVGLSRLVLLAVCYGVMRYAPRGLGPFFCGIASQVVPRAMFALFKGVYLAAMSVLRIFKRDTPLPLAGLHTYVPVTETCCICMENHCDYTTQCYHRFHHSCLRQWAERYPRCPLCNRALSYRPALCQKLKSWFILDFSEWKRHHRWCGDWWQEPFF